MKKRKQKRFKDSIVAVRAKKNMIEWAVLVTLILFAMLSYLVGLFSFEYAYLRCEHMPVEVDGRYYRVNGDNGYGLHIGSHYVCYGEVPEGAERDPSTEMGKKIAENKEKEKARIAAISHYTVYKPEGYDITSYAQSDNGDRMETSYRITAPSGREYSVRQMMKDSAFSYTNLCSKPPEENWSGTVIGKDMYGHEICKTNLSKYVQDYIVGMNIDTTGIMLQTKNDAPEEILNTEATAIFNAMKAAS